MLINSSRLPVKAEKKEIVKEEKKPQEIEIPDEQEDLKGQEDD